MYELSPSEQSYFDQIGEFYDRKMEDPNDINTQLLTNHDDVLAKHHHNGLLGTGYSDELLNLLIPTDVLQLMHHQENQLTQLGVNFLGYLDSDSKIVDLGCGAGGSAFIIHKASQAVVTGITLSHTQQRFAQDQSEAYQLNHSVNFQVMNMLHTDFYDEAYDAAYASESTEHAPELTVFFNESFRIVKQGGKMVVIAWCYNPDHEKGNYYKELIDGEYLTQIHSRKDYQKAAQFSGWKREYELDLTEPTAHYWRFRRDYSPNKLPRNDFMSEAFSLDATQYFLFTFLKPVL